VLADSFGRIATDLRVSVTDRCNLRTPLRAGADDDQLAAIWRRAVAVKLPGHGINDHGFPQPAQPPRRVADWLVPLSAPVGAWNWMARRGPPSLCSPVGW
jgi:molybdenum cofactor biosynthesis enzyme MoaA